MGRMELTFQLGSGNDVASLLGGWYKLVLGHGYRWLLSSTLLAHREGDVGKSMSPTRLRRPHLQSLDKDCCASLGYLES